MIQLYEDNANIRLVELLDKQAKITKKTDIIQEVEIPDITIPAQTVSIDENHDTLIEMT